MRVFHLDVSRGAEHGYLLAAARLMDLSVGPKREQHTSIRTIGKHNEARNDPEPRIQPIKIVQRKSSVLHIRQILDQPRPGGLPP
jgi:hypothetical protein